MIETNAMCSDAYVLWASSSPAVRADDRGATVCEIKRGVFEVLCTSHATSALSDDRARLEGKAARHNANWHPWLIDQ